MEIAMYAFHLQLFLLQRRQMGAARDEGHLMASASQQPAVIPSQPSSTNDRDFHLPFAPSVRSSRIV
jgi:hypothetical protein